MISFENSDRNYEEFDKSHLGNSPVYTLLAIYMPLSCLIAYIMLFNSLFSVNLNIIILIAAGALSAAAASFYFDFMKNVKASRIAANIRGAVIISILIYLLTSIFYFEASFGQRFIPNPVNIISVVSALYTWISVILLKTLFAARKLFEAITEKYEGAKLQAMLYEDSGLLSYTEENINKARTNYYAQIIIIFILALASIIVNTQMPIIIYFHLIILLASGVCIHGLFAIIKWEQYYAGEGIKLSGYERIKRVLAIILLSFSGLVLAGLLSSNTSIIPFSVITDFFAWLFSFFNREYKEIEMPAAEAVFQQENMGWGQIPYDELQRSLFWENLMKRFWIVIRYALIIFAVFMLIRFMIAPLINKGNLQKNLTFRQKLKLIITEWFSGIKNAITSFLTYIKNSKSKKLSKYSADEINRAAKMLFSAYSPAKKRDVQMSVTLFARLIIWGSDIRGVSWKPSLAPREYCDLLASSSPLNVKINKDIYKTGDLFEKALYSSDVLTNDEKKEFKELINEITSSAE
ncbi:MAG: hypothetical protein FWC21_01815 [Treponema sp.]|nr:hypothetical protein [Treponema sp.]